MGRVVRWWFPGRHFGLHHDRFKTELIADCVWRSRSQLELAIVEHIGWYNAARLHESLGDIPPTEYELQDARREAITLIEATA